MLVFTCYSSEALEIEIDPVQYTISLTFDGVATCTCRDFEQNGGACKHLCAALLLLDHLRMQWMQGIGTPAIPIPSSVTETHAPQTKTAIHQAERAAVSEDRPTVRAAAVIADLLCGDESVAVPLEEEEAPEDLDSEDAVSVGDVDTDASSDSSDEAAEDPSQRASNNLAILGEQALARTIYELQEVAPRLRDLAEFMKRKAELLLITEHEALSHRWGHLTALLAALDRLLFTNPAPIPTILATHAATQAPAPTSSDSQFIVILYALTMLYMVYMLSCDMDPVSRLNKQSVIVNFLVFCWVLSGAVGMVPFTVHSRITSTLAPHLENSQSLHSV
ncbi:hypothetical protein DFH07DRAFT_1036583 [Mycena maculata]|uniref:SWIM-type domain-containing protein n=1 Tax=Mycena maculata TaxID=230809 RepID=A0AAD7IQQ5_9AGAR|nr:hypothetical protein DFH07DRAFT_1036583 [Mycena maculata]